MNFAKLAESLLPVLGQKGVDTLQRKLIEMSLESSNEPWKKSVLALVANGVEQFGPQDRVPEGGQRGRFPRGRGCISPTLSNTPKRAATRNSLHALIVVVKRMLWFPLSAGLTNKEKYDETPTTNHSCRDDRLGFGGDFCGCGRNSGPDVTGGRPVHCRFGRPFDSANPAHPCQRAEGEPSSFGFPAAGCNRTEE